MLSLRQKRDLYRIDRSLARKMIHAACDLPENEQIKVRTLSAALMASTIHTGDDLSMGQAYAALHRWMKDNNYRIIGPPRQIHLHRGEHMHPTQYVTELQFPVEKQFV